MPLHRRAGVHDLPRDGADFERTVFPAGQAGYHRKGSGQGKQNRRRRHRSVSASRAQVEPPRRRALHHDVGHRGDARSGYRRAQRRHVSRYDHREKYHWGLVGDDPGLGQAL